MIDDNELLAFDANRTAGIRPGDQRKLLHIHGESYRCMLIAAMHFDRWAANVLEHPADYHGYDADSVAHAWRDAAAHLRQGDFLPGGSFWPDD